MQTKLETKIERKEKRKQDIVNKMKISVWSACVFTFFIIFIICKDKYCKKNIK